VKAAGYTRVSTDEQAERGHSLAEQERLIREHVEENGWTLVDVFRDPGYSGAREDRPGLQALLARVDELDVVVVWAPDRLARDVELWARLVKRFTAADVEVKALTAHVDLTTAEGVAMAGVSAVFGQFEKARIAERVRAALAARARKGRHPGGPPPDGWHDVDGERVHDPERAPVIERLFELAEQGLPDARISDQLNREGHRTRAGIPWTRRAVENHVTKPWHAGRVAWHRGEPDEQVFPGQHEPLVAPDVFDRIQAMRTARDRAPGAKKTGRPNTNHALARLAVCAKCGGRMAAYTSSYVRKDGSRRRFYRCVQAHDGSGMCAPGHPIDAEPVDGGVVAGLPTLMVDFDAWAARIRDEYGQEQARLEAELDRAELQLRNQTCRAEKVAAKWADMAAADDPSADGVAPQVQREQQAVLDAQALVNAARDALEAVPDGFPNDGMLDFANALQAAVKGLLTPGAPLVEVNAALRALFSCFVISESPGDGLFDGILIQPWLKVGAIAPPSDPELGWEWPKLVKPDDEPPPLRWLQPTPGPEGNVQGSQLYLCLKPNWVALAASQP
jgi:DNA invertase Pin-like site-specific DNA recombinase